MPIEPRKIVKLAKPGQLPGTKDAADDYREAAPLAYANPGEPVIVHEWDLFAAEADRKALERQVATEIRFALEALNTEDKAGSLPGEDQTPADTKIDGAQEHFQVSQATVKADKVIRTYIVFHPGGRPIRQRRTTGAAPAEFDPEQPEQVAPAEPEPRGEGTEVPADGTEATLAKVPAPEHTIADDDEPF